MTSSVMLRIGDNRPSRIPVNSLEMLLVLLRILVDISTMPPVTSATPGSKSIQNHTTTSVATSSMASIPSTKSATKWAAGTDSPPWETECQTVNFHNGALKMHPTSDKPRRSSETQECTFHNFHSTNNNKCKNSSGTTWSTDSTKWVV